MSQDGCQLLVNGLDAVLYFLWFPIESLRHVFYIVRLLQHLPHLIICWQFGQGSVPCRLQRIQIMWSLHLTGDFKNGQLIERLWISLAQLVSSFPATDKADVHVRLRKCALGCCRKGHRHKALLLALLQPLALYDVSRLHSLPSNPLVSDRHPVEYRRVQDFGFLLLLLFLLLKLVLQTTPLHSLRKNVAGIWLRALQMSPITLQRGPAWRRCRW
mmetsp:Transcript_105166/g.209069  ORF Transcript_105166/g.209069 Transcript_105166/m.209069 type:complete len:215 (-) Transcript_105166:361-1005(-)